MIPVGLPLIIQRHEKEIGTFEIFQGLLAGLMGGRYVVTDPIFQDRFAKGGCQALQNGCIQQKALDLRRLACQHLLQEVIENIAVRP